MQIVKKVDNQPEFNPSASQQPAYGDQGQLVNYQQAGSAAQLYSGEQYEQMQQAGYSMSTDYANYYLPTGQGNYLYAQQSSEFQSNYDQSGQLSGGGGLPPLDLQGQTLAAGQQIYQTNYQPNYAQQSSPYFDSPWPDSSSSLSQQITPLSAYQPAQQQHFSFNQYAQEPAIAGGQLINSLSFSQQPSNQFMQSQAIPQLSAQLGGQLANNQLTGQLASSDQSGGQLKGQPYATLSGQFSAQPLQPQATNQNSMANLQNVPPTGQPKGGQQPTKPVITSAAAGTIAPPLLNKIKQKMASHGSKMIASFKSSPTSEPPPSKAANGSGASDTRKASFCPATNQSSLNTEELTAHLTDEEKQILAKVFQKEEEFHRETR